MQIAMFAAGFSAGDADALRRGMAAWRRKGGLGEFEQRVVGGMLARGYEREFAQAIFRQIEGFGEYGFPESHAASFALLVYVSAWIKRHEPAAFLAALLNSQPLGFYAPAQLVRDAREHGVEVRAVDVLASDWMSTLEESDDESEDQNRRPQPAVRLGLACVRGLSEASAAGIVKARMLRLRERLGERPDATRCAPPQACEVFAFDSAEDLARCARLDAGALQALARAGALVQLSGHRANAHWDVAGITPLPEVLEDTRFDEAAIALAPPSEADDIVADYAALGIPMGRHPVALLRPLLARLRVQPAAVLRDYPNGRLARASGLVTHRQRPATAKGTMFVTLEDETGVVNVIVWPDTIERFRGEVLASRLMTVYGIWQCDDHAGGQVTHLVAKRVVDHSALLGRLHTASRDFH